MDLQIPSSTAPTVPKARIALAGALVTLVGTLVAGCGGSDYVPPVNPNNTLQSQQIGDAQTALDPSTASVDAGTATLTAAQIAAQTAALDGATTDGTSTIVANQDALDTAASVTPAF